MNVPELRHLTLERVPCPLCDCHETVVVRRSGDRLCGIPGEFTLERCVQCGHRFMNPRPVANSLADCYPDHYGPHQAVPDISQAGRDAGSIRTTAERTTPSESPDKGRGDARRPLWLRILPLRYIPGLKCFYRALMDDRSQPVPTPAASAHGSKLPVTPAALEIGCATGQYLIRLTQAGWLVTGIEPGERPAAAARAAGLDVHHGTLDDVSFPESSFELAAAWMVIEHVPNPRETLQQIHALLKPGGMLIFSIPNAGCWESAVFGRNWYVLELPRHLHHFTTHSITRLLQECGFEDIRIIHQRNVSNIVGSIALTILSWFPKSRFGRWLLRYPDQPRLPLQIGLAPFAHLLAWMRQGGRLTIRARCRKPESIPESIR